MPKPEYCKKMKRTYKTALFLIFALVSVNPRAQELSPVEKDIVASISRNNAGAVDFLEKVCNTNSGTFNPEGVRKVGQLFMNEFESLGFSTRWADMPAKMNRAGHMFAEIEGNTGKRLLLIGHIDTVFEADSPFQAFERVNDSIAHAPGGNDMKGGDVIVLYALKALHENGLLKDAGIIVAFTGDEEDTGSPLEVSRGELIAAAKRSDAALGFETATGYNHATVARRGASGWQLKVEGKRAHSSGIFSEDTGAGAVFETARILNEFYEQLKGEQYLTFNPGLVLGGTTVAFNELAAKGEAFGKTNVVAQTALVNGGLRFISEEQKTAAREKMQAIVRNNLPHTKATILFDDSYPAMSPTTGNMNLLSLLSEVSTALGQGPVHAYDPGKRGAADTSFVAEYVDCLDGLGTIGNYAHTPQETVDLNSIEAQTRRAALLIYRLIQQDR
jgi:glutamate carboxypeptidase